MRTLGPALLVLLVIAGCARTYESFQPPPLDFGASPPLTLRAGEVRIRSLAETPAAEERPEAPVPVSLEAAARQLLEHRLEAAGGPGAVQTTILEADVVEEPLTTRSGLRGYVVQEPVARLVGRLRVRVDRLDENGAVVSSLSTAVSRTAAIPEDATYVRRQEIAYDLVQNLVRDLDAGLVANIRQSLPTMVVPPA